MSHANVPTFSRAPMFDGGVVMELDRPRPTVGTRERLLFVLLCGVLVTSMCNGLVKQAFNWSQVAYVALDLPWVAFLLTWAIWGRPFSGRSTGGIGILLVAFIAYAALQVCNPLLESPFMAIGALRNRLLPMLFFWVGKDLLTPRRARLLLLAIFVIAAFGAAFGIFQWRVGLVGVTRWGPGFVPRTSLAWRTAEGESVLRPLSIYQDGGIAALFGGAVLFCMAMVYADRRSSLITWAVRAIGMLCLVFAAVSGVRAAVLCAVGGLGAAGFLSAKRVVPLSIVLVAAAGVMVALGAHVKLAERYKTILNPVDAYVDNRGDIALGFVELVSESPLGYGTGMASPANVFYAKTFGGLDDPKNLHSDNGYGCLVAEGGVPMVALYVGIMLLAMWRAWTLRRTGDLSVRSVAHGVFVFTAILTMWSTTALPIDWQPTNLIYWLLVGSLFAPGVAAEPTAARRPSRRTSGATDDANAWAGERGLT